MKKSYLLVAISLVFVSGCASQNDSLQARYNALETKEQAQEKQLADLKTQEQPMQDKVVNGAKDAYNWTADELTAAYNSDTSVEARARLQKCWDDLNKK